MKNKVLFMVVITIIWHLTGYFTKNSLPEMPKKVLGAVMVCWLVYTLFRRPLDDDDWAGQC